jgi:hypothetical protein
LRSIQLPARSLRFVRTGRRCGRRRLRLRARGCLSRCVARARPFARSLRRDTGRLAALGPSPTPPSALTLCSTPLRACALAAGVTARRSDDASLAAGILPALACARFSFRLEHCVPFARVFAVVGDGCGSALAAASRDASPKRDPSRGHSLSKGQVATPAALPRSRLRRLLPPLSPSSLHFVPAPWRRASPPAGAPMPALRPEFFQRSLALAQTSGVSAGRRPKATPRAHPVTTRTSARRCDNDQAVAQDIWLRGEVSPRLPTGLRPRRENRAGSPRISLRDLRMTKFMVTSGAFSRPPFPANP